MNLNKGKKNIELTRTYIAIRHCNFFNASNPHTGPVRSRSSRHTQRSALLFATEHCHAANKMSKRNGSRDNDVQVANMEARLRRIAMDMIYETRDAAPRSRLRLRRQLNSIFRTNGIRTSLNRKRHNTGEIEHGGKKEPIHRVHMPCLIYKPSE